MSKRIEELAKKMNFDRDEYGMFWDQDGLNDGVDLEKFARLIVEECCQALNPMLRDQISRGQGVDLIKKHFEVE